MKSGFVCLDKGLGLSSNYAVVKVRRMLPKGTAVGHGGTLDPDASGVLPVCIGTATRLFDYIIDRRKVYETVLQLGQETNTQDATGEVVRELPYDADEAAVRAILPRFTGNILQIPPMYSAIKRDGVRMYQLARKGEEMELEPRPVVVDGIEYVADEGNGRHRLRVACHRGVYIRTLCHDMGLALGTVAHMASLRRTCVEEFSLENALTLDKLMQMNEEGRLEDAILPADYPISYLPEVRAKERCLRLIRNGNPLTRNELDRDVPDGPCRLYAGDRFCGIVERDGDGVKFRCMLLRDE